MLSLSRLSCLIFKNEVSKNLVQRALLSLVLSTSSLNCGQKINKNVLNLKVKNKMSPFSFKNQFGSDRFNCFLMHNYVILLAPRAAPRTHARPAAAHTVL